VKRDVTISIRVSAEQKEQLDQIAKSERRPVSQLAYLLVEEGLQRRAKARSDPPG
jgi:predicted transcriptional regulator